MKPHSKEVDVNRNNRIKQIARVIRKKYWALKLGKSEEDESSQEFFKPISTSLKQLNEIIQNIKKEPEEIKEEISNPEYDNAENDAFDPEYDMTNIAENVFETKVDLSKYPEMAYLHRQNHLNKHEKIDRVFGSYYNVSNSKWMLRKGIIDFTNGNIKILDHAFTATPGLYELISNKSPRNHDAKDQDSYKKN
ncbi:hypothetical protein JTB14_024420 [Gonioctena quinquepunctata]|nr:hypothetical protein JTB14_024420 [Gonioctena quinquepunctata]